MSLSTRMNRVYVRSLPISAKLAAVLPNLTGQSVWLDVGANVGIYSLLAGRANPAICVYAFEPAPDTFAQLQNNIQLNGLDKVEAYQQAVGDKIGQVRLFFSDNDCNASVLAGFRQAQGEIQVPMTTLDDFVATGKSFSE